MVQLITTDKHQAIKSSSEVTEICQPLLQFTPISFFNLVRVYDNHARLSFSNNQDWLEHYYKQQYHNESMFSNSPFCLENKFMTHTSFPDNIVIRDAIDNFDICYGFVLIDRQAKHTDFFHFATSHKNSSVMNFYLNSIDMLEHFTFYFRDKAANLIKKCKPNVPVDTVSMFSEAKDLTDLTCERHKYLAATKLSKLQITLNNKVINLTRREIQTLWHYLQGKTAKEIAKAIYLSPRTVEYYLVRIKKKLNCQTRHDLFKMVMQSELLQEMDLLV